MKIYLVRHAQELEDGTRDGGITPLGRRQAYAAARYLKKLDVKAILASNLPRAHDTAHAVDEILKLGVKTSATLQEIQTPKGAWAQYIKTRHPDFDYRPGGGESISELITRAKKGWEEILDAAGGQDVGVVGHGIFTKALLYTLGFKEFLIRNEGIANTGITTLEVNDGEVSLVKFNYYGHLLGELQFEEILRRIFGRFLPKKSQS